MWWQVIRGSMLQAAVFIKLYLQESGRRCFTYRGLRAWWSRNRKWEGSEWHTVERSIRRLAERGYLERRQYGKRVVFCPTTQLYYVFQQLDDIIVKRGATP